MAQYPYKTQPYKHQVKALKKSLKLKQCALLMEPRTGKTKVAIDYLSALAMAGKLDRAVIVAPARVLDVWVEEFHVHCPVRFHLTVWDAEARTGTETVKGKTNTFMVPPPKVNAAYDLSVVLVNYEAFQTSGKTLPSGNKSKRTGRFAVRKTLIKWLEDKPAAMILDESHRIKSPAGKVSTMLVSMRPQFDYRLILTGTPVTKANRVFDLYMQWKFLNPQRFTEWSTAEEFKEQFGKWTHVNGYPQFKGTQNIDVLNRLLHKDSYRVKRSECFDLPEKTERIISVPLRGKGAKVYDDMAETMVAEIEHQQETHKVEATLPIVMILRLLQITGGFITKTTPDDKRLTLPVGDDKLKVFEGLLEEAIENDEKLVVCARFRGELDAISKLVRSKKIRCYEIRGGMKRQEVTGNIKAFKDFDGCAVVAMNPRAGGVGIDLSTASHMVWYSLTHSWVDYTQACDRIALSKKATQYTYLLAEGTVDQVVYQSLQNDGDISERVLRNPRAVLRK